MHANAIQYTTFQVQHIHLDISIVSDHVANANPPHLRMTQLLETVLLLHLLHWMSLNDQTSNVVGLAGSLESEAPRKFDHIYIHVCMLSLVIFRYALRKKTYIFSEGMFRIYMDL